MSHGAQGESTGLHLGEFFPTILQKIDWTCMPSRQGIIHITLPSEGWPLQNQAEPLNATEIEFNAIWNDSVYLELRSLEWEEETRDRRW